MDYPKTRMDNFFAKAAGSELADDSMEPITDREYWINEMAKKTAGGGLPTIEEGDDGKVLTVSSGEAVWASGGGGGGGSATIVECTVSGHTKTATMTAGEIIEAFHSGVVIGTWDEDDGYDYFHYEYILDFFQTINGTYVFDFGGMQLAANQLDDYPSGGGE